MMKKPGYLAQFLDFWTVRPEVKKVWFSLFTPQVGDQMPEILSPSERAQAITDMLQTAKAVSEIGYAPGGHRAIRFAAEEPG